MKRSLVACICLLLLLVSCNNKATKGDGQTWYSGSITIAVDESLKPIMEEELQVYRAMFPEA